MKNEVKEEKLTKIDILIDCIDILKISLDTKPLFSKYWFGIDSTCVGAFLNHGYASSKFIVVECNDG